MEDAVARLEAVTGRLEKALAKMGGAPVEEGEIPQYVTNYEALMAKEGQAFFDAVKKVGGDDDTGMDTTWIEASFNNVTSYLKMTTVCKKPTPQQIMTFCAPIVDGGKKSDKLCGTRKKALFKYANFHKALHEVMQANYWVSMYPPTLPMTHVKSSLESADFHLNRILTKDGKTDENKAFVKTSKDLLKALMEFIKENDMKTGITFIGKEDISSAKAPAAGDKPAPKKEKKKEEEVAEKPKKEDAAAAEKKANALLAGLNKGLKATSGLKKSQKGTEEQIQERKSQRQSICRTQEGKGKEQKEGCQEEDGSFQLGLHELH